MNQPFMWMWKKPCHGCPFTASSIVSPERVKDIVQTCNAQDVHFNCHKNKEGDVTGAAGNNPICRGYFEKVYVKTGAGQLTRIAERLGGIEERECPPEKVRKAKRELMPFRKMKGAR